MALCYNRGALWLQTLVIILCVLVVLQLIGFANEKKSAVLFVSWIMHA